LSIAKQPQNQNYKLQTKNMEVHHHPHVERKNFKEYLLEFLMIFLAVTMGFIAENLREVITENKRAKELAASLHNDLIRDTVALNSNAAFRNHKIIHMDSLFLILKENPGKIEAHLFFHFILLAFSTDNFSDRQSTGTIAQLKNAGYLRYYTQTDIPRALAAYESSVSSLSEMEKTEQQQVSGNGFAFLKEEIDPSLFNIGYSGNIFPDGTYVIPHHPDAFRLLYGNCVSIEILNRNIAHYFISNTKKKAVELMRMLEKEYDLKKE
jgi:hypothetical protein